MKKALGILVLAVALLMPAQGIVAAEEGMKMMQDTDKKLDSVMKMMKEKKLKMTPEQEKEMMRRFQDFNQFLDDLMKRAG